ncbi:hypothetical protein I215_01225 [Galbibacter marinus]|uniref:Uncharacterized protein n=1 Tax=Galbibacter marinus TaxID=555500 RepID=K2P755_9FLAO|nr:hypothetical protein [Galbibacter marinus]EKF56793.1 hypothetical protein I215_01225 [Galbibacter marinus]
MNILSKIVLQSGCFLVYCSSTLAQQANLKVFIYQNDKAVEQFGIANLSKSIEGQYSDGYHQIMANQGDELFVASKEFKNFYKIVSKTDIDLGYIEVYMDKGVIALDEVVLNQRKLSYGTFTAYKPKMYTPAEARLKAASKSYYKGNGMRLGLDPLINMISGRTKTLKKELKAEGSDMIVEFLHSNYRKFIREELGVSEPQYYLFCYYVSDQNNGIHKIGNQKRVEFLLRRLYFKFLQ